MKKTFLAIFFLCWLQTNLSLAQISVGVKGGFTATTGYLSTPQQSVLGTGTSIPAITNKNDGIGFGGVAGVYAKYNLSDQLFVMAEVEYNHYTLRQRSAWRSDVNALTGVRSGLPISFPDGSTFANVSNRSEITYQNIRIPLAVGTSFGEGKYRVFAGPTLFLPVASEITNFTSANIESNSAVGFTGAFVPQQSTTANLMKKEGGILEVKRFTWGADLGVGYTFPDVNVDLDLRYSVNLGGLTKNTDVKGFFGAFLVTIGYRFWNSGESTSSTSEGK